MIKRNGLEWNNSKRGQAYYFLVLSKLTNKYKKDSVFT